jgi:CPA2 family monovalent cation:H+ antiporter-2
MDAHGFLVALTVILGVAAVTTVVFQRLKQPVILGYLLAGFILGPSNPIPLFADRQLIQTLSELGVILLMFSLGLEFSLGRFLKLGPTAGLTALLETSLMASAGFLIGQAFGWSTLESVFCGGIVAISSTTIIARTFDEQRVTGSLKELVVGVLIVEDLIAIFLMATLTTVASGAGVSPATMVLTTAKLLLFLVVLIGVGLVVVPRGVRAVLALGRPETTLVAAVGFCFAVSLLAHTFGYSVALGAFIAGSLVAESGEGHTIEHLVRPVRDIFAAIFFVSVGVLIDPALIAAHWLPIVVLTIVVVAGKMVGVSLGAFLTGNPVRTSVQAGMSMAQIGEFSFIIATLGLSLGATGSFLHPVAVAVSAVTTLTTPWLVRVSGPVANLVDKAMPKPLQTFVVLYGSWVEQIHTRPTEATLGVRIRRLVRLLIVDVAALALLAVATRLGQAPLSTFLREVGGIEGDVARAVVYAGIALVGVPLGAGLVRVAGRLGLALAEAALPAAKAGALDLAASPRRALVVTLQLAIVLLCGLGLLAVTQPFVGGAWGSIVLVVVVAGFGVSFWRGTTDLHGHVQAGAQVVAAALLAQARSAQTSSPSPSPSPSASSLAEALEQVQRLLPGIGDPTPVVLGAGDAAVGQTLGELQLRSVTGATVLAITRAGQELLEPASTEALQAGDTLALVGSHGAIDAAIAVLTTPSTTLPPGDEPG